MMGPFNPGRKAVDRLALRRRGHFGVARAVVHLATPTYSAIGPVLPSVPEAMRRFMAAHQHLARGAGMLFPALSQRSVRVNHRCGSKVVSLLDELPPLRRLADGRELPSKRPRNSPPIETFAQPGLRFRCPRCRHEEGGRQRRRARQRATPKIPNFRALRIPECDEDPFSLSRTA